MNCPSCKDALLLMSDRGGVEIDYCPQCRGVWLDRGELDKLISRDRDDDRSYDRSREDDRWYDRSHGGDGYTKRRKRKGFLSEMFEFGD